MRLQHSLEALVDSRQLQLQILVMGRNGVLDQITQPCRVPVSGRAGRCVDRPINFWDVLTTADCKQARRLLLDTMATTRKHFEKEEKTIFVIAERELTQQEQERLGAEWAARRCGFLS